MADYMTYLGAHLLNDNKIVTYRLLSRELGVHSNSAKRMLFEFHQRQNAKSSGSVHACFLLDGTPRKEVSLPENGHAAEKDDAHIQGSPVINSSMPQDQHHEKFIPGRGILLVKDDDLEAAKSTFKQLHSVHIYSLSSASTQNLEILSECNRQISGKFVEQDPLVFEKQYGVIVNTRVRRRTEIRPPGVTSALPGARQKTSQKPDVATYKVESQTDSHDSQSTGSATPRSGHLSRDSSRPDETSGLASKPEKKTVARMTSSKHQQSNVFKSFVKPKPTLEAENINESVGGAAAADHWQSTTSVQEDEPMRDVSEDEQEDEFGQNTINDAVTGESKSERTEKLRKMMDAEDEDMTESSTELGAEFSPPDTGGQPIVAVETSPKPPSSSGRRRRGRRKVTKKVTIKDEEGYLVTKEEPAWESFSEEDRPVGKEKTLTSAAGSTNMKKVGSKSGQGDIMSFFGKK